MTKSVDACGQSHSHDSAETLACNSPECHNHYPCSPRNARCTTGLSIGSSFICPMGCSCRMFREAGLEHCIRSFGFELQGRCSAFASWRARKRHPKTFSLAAHNRELVLGQSWTSKRSRGAFVSPPRPSSFAYRVSLNRGEARSRLVAAIRPSTSARYRTRGQR